jgi:hypothetical protein
MPGPRLILAVNWRFARRIPEGTVVADLATRTLISTHEQATLPRLQFRAAVILLSIGVGKGIDRKDVYEALWGDDHDGGPLYTWVCFHVVAKRALQRAPWLGIDCRSVGYRKRIEVVSTAIASPYELRDLQRLAA